MTSIAGLAIQTRMVIAADSIAINIADGQPSDAPTSKLLALGSTAVCAVGYRPAIHDFNVLEEVQKAFNSRVSLQQNVHTFVHLMETEYLKRLRDYFEHEYEKAKTDDCLFPCILFAAFEEGRPHAFRIWFELVGSDPKSFSVRSNQRLVEIREEQVTVETIGFDDAAKSHFNSLPEIRVENLENIVVSMIEAQIDATPSLARRPILVAIIDSSGATIREVP